VREGLPTGTVTFLFTDMDGSTRLGRQAGDPCGRSETALGTLKLQRGRPTVTRSFEQRRAEGEAMSVDEGVAYALSPDDLEPDSRVENHADV
jgi:hypothetical protein